MLASAMVIFRSVVNTCEVVGKSRAGEGPSRTATCDPRGRGLNDAPSLCAIGPASGVVLTNTVK